MFMFTSDNIDKVVSFVGRKEGGLQNPPQNLQQVLLKPVCLRECLIIWLGDHQMTKCFFIRRWNCLLRLCPVYFVDTTLAINANSSVQFRHSVRAPGTIVHTQVPGRNTYIDSPTSRTTRNFEERHWSRFCFFCGKPWLKTPVYAKANNESTYRILCSSSAR
jgi:hypothetical protein